MENVNYERRRNKRTNKEKVVKIVAIALCFVGLLLCVIATMFIDVNVTLNGPSEITIEKGTVFEDPGAVAVAVGHTVEVKVYGQVDTQTAGTYTITYQGVCLLSSGEAIRTVHVVETPPPTIQLTGDATIDLPFGTEYQEPGYTATDSEGNDLTALVVVSGTVDTTQEGTYTLTYTVTDSLHHSNSIQRVVTVGPPPPTIELIGGAELSIYCAREFEDPGFTALDSRGNDLSEQVVCTGTVDSLHPGTYTLSYSVTDSNGYTTTVERTVTVLAVNQPENVTPDGKVIYLTFDDGPSAYTEKLLAVLEKYNVKATFFVVDTGGPLSKRLNAIVDGGHSIGIHSVHHDWNIYSSEEDYLNDLYEMQKRIKDATGVTTTLMRFIGGSSNTISRNYCKGIMTTLTKSVTDLGFQYFDWHVDSNDAGGAKTAEEVYNNVINGVSGRKRSVVLQHDIKSFSVDAVEQIIQWGLANGYTFLPLTADSPTCHHPVNN